MTNCRHSWLFPRQFQPARGRVAEAPAKGSAPGDGGARPGGQSPLVVPYSILRKAPNAGTKKIRAQPWKTVAVEDHRGGKRLRNPQCQL